MPQSECIKVRLKPGMTNKFLEWAKRVPNRMGEAKLIVRSRATCASEGRSIDNGGHRAPVGEEKIGSGPI